MQGNSRVIQTQQLGVHEKLDAIVKKYQQTTNQRPVNQHTRAAFDAAVEWLGDWQGEVILDSCCGVGQSTAGLARQFPEARIIGLDKSALRVGKHAHYQAQTSNYTVIRADVVDFWRLLREVAETSNWKITRHYMYYPNPYPKSSQVQKRWHASQSMPDLMALSPRIEVRSNWLIYLQEFVQAAHAYGVRCEIEQVDDNTPAVTPFEAKYRHSGQSCWRLTGLKTSPITP